MSHNTSAQIEWDYVENQGYRELVKEERKEDSKMTVNPSPGPWSAKLNSSQTQWLVLDNKRRIVAEMSWYSSSKYGVPRMETDVNVKLVVAAPTMLQVLERTRTYLLKVGVAKNDKLLDDVLYAISIAKGKKE